MATEDNKQAYVIEGTIGGVKLPLKIVYSKSSAGVIAGPEGSSNYLSYRPVQRSAVAGLRKRIAELRFTRNFRPRQPIGFIENKEIGRWSEPRPS